MRTALRAASAAGCLIFLGVAALSFAGPRFFERRAKTYLVERLRGEVVEKHPALAAADLDGAIARLREHAETTRKLLESRYPDALGLALASLCKHDCEQAPLTALVRDVLHERLQRLEGGIDRLRRWAQGRFDELIDRLLRDVRIFALTNAVMFLLAFLMASADPLPRAVRLISGALMAGAAAGTLLYVFGQNWLQIFIFSDYAGFAYVAWVALIVGAELDVLFNRGRVTQTLLHAVQAVLSH